MPRKAPVKALRWVLLLAQSVAWSVLSFSVATPLKPLPEVRFMVVLSARHQEP
jgi:hypothetical protein